MRPRCIIDLYHVDQSDCFISLLILDTLCKGMECLDKSTFKASLLHLLYADQSNWLCHVIAQDHACKLIKIWLKMQFNSFTVRFHLLIDFSSAHSQTRQSNILTVEVLNEEVGYKKALPRASLLIISSSHVKVTLHYSTCKCL